MLRSVKLAVSTLALGAALLLLAATALGRTGMDLGYTKSQTYNAALRYLRVDLGYEVTERNPRAAYLLFRYKSVGQREPTPGSIEVVPNGQRVKVFVNLPQMPKYHEQVLVDGLLKKLRTEYGEPPRRRTRKEPEGDAGA